MESPPPYAAPRKKRTATIVWVIVGVAACCCLCLVGIGGFGYQWFRNSAIPFASCSMNLQFLRDGMVNYAEDHAGKLPSGPTWKQDVWPYYLKQPRLGHQAGSPFTELQENGQWGCAVGDNRSTVFVYNSDLAGKKIADVRKKSEVPLIFEAPTGSPSSGPYSKPDLKTSPAIIFGQQRGWMDIGADGDPMLNTPDGKRTPFKVNSRSRGGIQIQTSGN